MPAWPSDTAGQIRSGAHRRRARMCAQAFRKVHGARHRPAVIRSLPKIPPVLRPAVAGKSDRTPGSGGSYTERSMTGLPKLPLIAAIFAFLTAAGALFSAINGMPAAAPLALIPLFAGIGILRKQIWSAYGYALFTFAQLLLLPLVVLRAGDPAVEGRKVAATAFFGLLIATLFVFAGRSLSQSGAKRGSPV